RAGSLSSPRQPAASVAHRALVTWLAGSIPGSTILRAKCRVNGFNPRAVRGDGAAEWLGGGEAEDLAVEGQFGTEGLLGAGRTAEAVALIGEHMHLRLVSGLSQGVGHGGGLLRGHHPVAFALEDDHRCAEPAQVVDGGAIPVALPLLRIRADELIEVAGLEFMCVSAQYLQ